MKMLIDNLAWVLPALALAGILIYALWWRELPRVEGCITGDYATAANLASQHDAPLFLAVDNAPS